MPPGQQSFKRTKMVLPLRLWTDEENGLTELPQLAHTVDISPVGARLGGLPKQLQCGQVITLQRGKNRNRFRVIWTKQLGSNEIRAGIEAIEPGKKLWDLNLPDEPVSSENVAGKAASEPKSVAPDSRTTPARFPIRVDRFKRTKSSVVGLYHLPAGKYLRARWVQAVAAVIVVGATVLLIQSLSPRNVQVASALPESISTPAPAPVASTSARVKDGVRVIFAKGSSDSASDSSSRVRVAETPQGHIVYPDPPEANLSGKVNLKVVIGMAGRVKEIWVLSGNRELAKAAIEAVRQWRYDHHERDGQAVEAETNVSIEFQGQDAVSIHFPTPAPIGAQS